MRHELRLIPPAPRQPRWPPVLWARWPLALLAFLASVYGGAITLMFVWSWGGKASDDAALDARAVEVEATVTDVTPVRMTLRGEAGARVAYRFVGPEGETCEGDSFARADQFAAGAPAIVEYLPGQPHVNRLRGTRINLVRDFAAPLWRWMVLPGVGCLALWFLWALATRRALAHGDVALADLDEVCIVRYVMPRMLRVRYRFRDYRARERHGWHWVRARSVLGFKLLGAPTPDQVPVVHSRRRPWASRLVTADDFIAPPSMRPRGPGADLPHWMDQT